MSERAAAKSDREPVWAEFQSLDGLKAMICVGSIGPRYWLPVYGDVGMWTRDADIPPRMSLNIREYRLIGEQERGEGAFRKCVLVYREVAR